MVNRCLMTEGSLFRHHVLQTGIIPFAKKSVRGTGGRVQSF